MAMVMPASPAGERDVTGARRVDVAIRRELDARRNGRDTRDDKPAMTAIAPAPSKRRSPRRIAKALGLAIAAAATTVAGVLIAGGVITDDFRLSMALTAAWYIGAGALALVSLKAGRSIGIPILAGYLIASIATGGYLAATTLVDRTVNETVVTGMPASEVPAAPQRKRTNVEEARGRFVSAEHATSGTARVVKLASGRRVLTLTDFETSAGPDLRVRIGDADLGALKGNRGDQQYGIPEDVDPRGGTVRIWCRAFSALFGSAALRAS
jgi:hypothetical protein